MESHFHCIDRLKVDPERRRLLFESLFRCDRQLRNDSERRRLLSESHVHCNKRLKVDSERRRLLLESHFHCIDRLNVDPERRRLLLESRIRVKTIMLTPSSKATQPRQTQGSLLESIRNLFFLAKLHSKKRRRLFEEIFD